MTVLGNNVLTAVVHGLKVAGHIAVAIIVYGIVAYIGFHQDQFGTLAHYGLTIGVVNSILAAAWKWANLPTAQTPVIDTLPPQQPPTA